MNAHNAGAALHDAESMIADPGASGTITVNKSLSQCNIITLTTETRVLARPTRAGVVFTLHFRTDGGDCTITPAGGYSEGGATTIVLQHPGQVVTLMSVREAAGTLVWRATFQGAGAALTAQLTALTITDAAGTPDYALSALTTTTPYGLATLAEMVTLLYVVQNLQVRVAEMEAIMEANGWLQAN